MLFFSTNKTPMRVPNPTRQFYNFVVIGRLPITLVALKATSQKVHESNFLIGSIALIHQITTKVNLILQPLVLGQKD